MLLGDICGGDEESWAARCCFGRQWCDARVAISGIGEQLLDGLGAEAEVGVAHRLLEDRVIVFEHVDDQDASVGPENAPDFPESILGIADMVKHEDECRGVRCGIIDGQVRERAVRETNIPAIGKSLPCSAQHRFGGIDGDNLAHARRENLGDIPSAATDVRDDPVRREQREQPRRGEVLAEEFLTQPIPLARDAPEEGERVVASFRENDLESHRIFIEVRIGIEMLAERPPERSRVLGEIVLEESVVLGGALGPLGDPVGVRERLEMPADGALGELDDIRDLPDAQFRPLQDVADAQAHGLADGGETLGEGRDGGGRLHPCMWIVDPSIFADEL